MGITNILLSAVAALTEPNLSDGQVSPLTVNADGRLRIAGKPALFPATTGVVSAVAATLIQDVTDCSNVVIHVKNTGTATMAAGTWVFEGSVDSTNGTDGTWFGIQAVRSNANTVETGAANLAIAAAAGALYSWEASVNAYRWIRVRCTVAVTASSIATWTILRGSYATEPIPAIQPNVVSGTVSITPAAPSAYAVVSTASTNAAVIKATAGSLVELTIFNPTAAIIYAKLYNKATAPVPGTDVPLLTLPVPINGLTQNEFGQMGKRFTAGLGIALTSGPLATDVAVVAAGAQVSVSYI